MANPDSGLSKKQLTASAVKGRMVTFHISFTEETISGYLCGMDDFHWMVITPSGSKHLIHKANVSVVDLLESPTYANEENHEELESVVAPFRDWIDKEIRQRVHDERASSR